MTVNEIMQAIPTLERDELRRVQLYAERYLKYRTATKYRPGSRVSFLNGSRIVTGKVIRVNKNTVSVQPDGGGTYWRVSPSFLSVVE